MFKVYGFQGSGSAIVEAILEEAGQPYESIAVARAADIYAALLAAWSPDMPALFARHPNIRRLYDGVVARPAVAKVWKRHAL